MINGRKSENKVKKKKSLVKKNKSLVEIKIMDRNNDQWSKK
tara:strand:- start:88 stop:210 length:123 start_codon:yes stop_codon:yes gene_type:complete